MTEDHVATVVSQWRTERPDLDVSPQEVIARLHRVANALTEELVAVYAEFGLGEGEFDVLATLRRSGKPYELSAGELAAQTMVTSGAISKRVDRCVEAGWVSRTVAADDARGRRVRLTAAGVRHLDRAFTAHIANEHRLLEPLSRRDRDALARALQHWAVALGV
jgi:DNA-binding MarR family transcriptional regulator